MVNYHNKTIKDEKGSLKQGHEYITLTNMFGYDEIAVLIRWRDGRLHDDGELPAVEFQDCHVEHYRHGLLHNEEIDLDGNLKPAIITDFCKKFEYYLNGRQVSQNSSL
jgi:hypothetical protein